MAGISFGKDDMLVPPSKERIINETQKEIEKIQSANSRGIITEGERYLKVIDAWTHARERIGEDMLHELRNDTRDGKPHINPIYCMIMSKARGSVEQIRQLAGMRGLMAKPSGKLHMGLEPEQPDQVGDEQNDCDGRQRGRKAHQLRPQRPVAKTLIDLGPVDGLVLGSRLGQGHEPSLAVSSKRKLWISSSCCRRIPVRWYTSDGTLRPG